MRKEEIQALAEKDPLSFGITYVDLLEGRKWEVDDRAWIKEIYSVINPWYIERYPEGQARQAAFQKPTQVGLSTFGIVRMLHLASNWVVRIGYSLPRQKDVIDFVSTRLNPMLERSAFLKNLLGEPNATYTKKLGASYIFMLEASVESRMIPLDALFRDEIDLSDPSNLGTMMNRLDASKWKLVFDFSTPTLPNFGINKYFEQSDKREWFVKCNHCGYWQQLFWDKNLEIEGPDSRPTSVRYVCSKCKKELTPQHIQTGQWVPEFPERSRKVIGFHISQMMTHPADELYDAYIDPQTSIKEFYRKRLGIPYSVEGGQISREDFLVNCFQDQYEPEAYHDGRSQYYMGVDQGNQLQAVVAKRLPDNTRPRIVWVELIDPDAGFDRVGQLMSLYKVKRAIIDADPNRHSARSLTLAFPGRIMMADYAEIKGRYDRKKNKNTKIHDRVVINRTEMFDNLMESIRSGKWGLFGDPTRLPPDAELLIDHVTSLRRDTEERRTASGSVEVGVWRPLRADHLAHAMGYLKIALDIDKASGFRVASSDTEDGEEETENEEEQTRKGIIWFLSEVPKEQLREFVKRHEDEDYTLPFPLSYKLPKALNIGTIGQVIETIKFMIS